MRKFKGMGISLIYTFLFLSILFLIGVVILFFSIRKKSIIGILCSVILVSPLILLITINFIDELSITKKDVVSDLTHLELNLQDDFKIIENSVTGMPERIQSTKLQISKDDKKRMIHIIQNASNFRTNTFKNDMTEQFDVNDIVENYKFSAYYAREVFKIIDDYPTRLVLTIDERSNIIKYQRIED